MGIALNLELTGAAKTSELTAMLVLLIISLFNHRNVGYKQHVQSTFFEALFQPIYLRCNLKELRTTEMELKAIAPDAIIGFSLPSAATGIAIVL